MELLQYLKSEPRARERKNKNRAIGNVILNKYNWIGKIEKEIMANAIGEILSFDRKWRKILEENPDLRGSDYNSKDMLEEEAMIKLGYNITPKQDKTLFP